MVVFERPSFERNIAQFGAGVLFDRLKNNMDAWEKVQMDRVTAFEEVVASEAIEFVESSNVEFFLPGHNDGVLYVGFTASFLPESDPVPRATAEYFGMESWDVRLYAYFSITVEQVEGMRLANSKGRFVWEQFIDRGATYEYIGNVKVENTQKTAFLYV